MPNTIQHKEYSARFGLKHAIDDIEAAQQLAEAKYRALVGREIWFSEINEIHELIEELQTWTCFASSQSAPSCQLNA